MGASRYICAVLQAVLFIKGTEQLGAQRVIPKDGMCPLRCPRAFVLAHARIAAASLKLTVPRLVKCPEARLDQGNR